MWDRRESRLSRKGRGEWLRHPGGELINIHHSQLQDRGETDKKKREKIKVTNAPLSSANFVLRSCDSSSFSRIVFAEGGGLAGLGRRTCISGGKIDGREGAATAY